MSASSLPSPQSCDGSSVAMTWPRAAANAAVFGGAIGEPRGLGSPRSVVGSESVHPRQISPV